eukprot:1192828-Pleurochrysis_carterae.AAC.1
MQFYICLCPYPVSCIDGSKEAALLPLQCCTVANSLAAYCIKEGLSIMHCKPYSLKVKQLKRMKHSSTHLGARHIMKPNRTVAVSRLMCTRVAIT